MKNYTHITMENHKEEIIKASKACAVIKCCIILLLIAMFICMAGDQTIISQVKSFFN